MWTTHTHKYRRIRRQKGGVRKTEGNKNTKEKKTLKTQKAQDGHSQL